MKEFNNLKEAVNQLIDEGCGAHFAIRFGNTDDYNDLFFGEGVTADTNFDLASVSKVFATTAICLMAFDEGKLTPDTLVSEFFSCPVDKQGLKIRHLMTHGLGFGHKPLNAPEINYDNVAEYILNLPCEFPVGTDALYSCPAFILLGKILEKIYGKRLDLLFKEKVTTPLKLNRTGFGSEKENTINSNKSEEDRGIVNDYNCRHLGCVAGNAGVFSNLNDLTVFVRMLLNGGSPLIRPETLKMARQNYTATFSSSRGMGFLYVDERYKQTGKLFNVGAFGHCGHTGQSVFMDADSGFFVIILSDMTIKVDDEYDRVMQAREKIHNAIKADLI